MQCVAEAAKADGNAPGDAWAEWAEWHDASTSRGPSSRNGSTTTIKGGSDPLTER